MPGIFYQPVRRRAFLTKTITAAGALTVLVRAQTPTPEAAETSRSLRLALLSDTHTPADPANEYRGFQPQSNLKTVVPQVAETEVEAVLICGDAARLSGEIADYQALQQILKPLAGIKPIFIGLGNHDNRDNFYQTFTEHPGQRQRIPGKHVLVLDHPVLRLVLLDSLLHVNRTPGLLGKAQRTWLAQYLNETDPRPTALFVHHTLDDGDGELLDVERLFTLIKPYPQVKAIFYGHSHRYAIEQRDGIALINLPAVGYNFNDQEPVGWVNARFHPEGVELTLNAIAGNENEHGKTRSVTWNDRA